MVLAIIQARLGSNRFPRKALADLCGKPVIARVVERVNQIRGVDICVVAVPLGEADAFRCCTLVVNVAVPESDVLARFAAVARFLPQWDTIMRITGDCPLLQPDVCDRVIDLYRTSGADYAWTDTRRDWPDGLDCEVFSRQVLLQAHANAYHPSDREHVTPWIRRSCKVAALPPDPSYRSWPKCSIDTVEDLEVVRRWIAEREWAEGGYLEHGRY